MSTNTGIEWTDATWNPIRGCSRVSEGCRNCYAERVAYRFSGAGQPYEGLAQLVNGHAAWTGKVNLVEKHLLDPLKWKPVKAGGWTRGTPFTRPRRIFVNSMGDLFHPNVPVEWIDRIFAVMALCPQHTFQVLTKRPERMLAYLENTISRTMIYRAADDLWLSLHPRGDVKAIASMPLPNVHLGVSVEDQKTADERIPLLLQTPAAVRFISAEPLLGEITFRWAKWDDWSPNDRRAKQLPSVERGGRVQAGCVDQHDGLRMLDWVICGGESGPGARPMHPDWARSLRDACVSAGVPFFFKQWGEYRPVGADEALGSSLHDAPIFEVDEDATTMIALDGRLFPDGESGVGGYFMERVGKKAAGSLLDGREWKEFPGLLSR